ncbi:MAG: hypothetical protein P8Y70_03770 [Candidatus Lokiarchaeota archaeon]
MRAQACIKCKEYVLIHPGDPVNKKMLDEFKGKHRGHTVITVELEEIKGKYKKLESTEQQESNSSSISAHT